MDISGVSPERLVSATLQQRETQTQLEAQVGLLKDTQEAQGDAIMSLIAAVPAPQPDGSLGNNVDLRV
ncbi:hypothetical protein [Marinospirillum insulare]|uniref:Motility protein n=1 Tax=Marinospirillum insulare TaxID=217169 RepID=A0ABQ5ZVM0_9GAMM|nr:hypothetical protein [Marinospirillum insulare]GLR62716.1 hypothetical protein GCM10007878_01510 [Marinospirillum insulare]